MIGVIADDLTGAAEMAGIGFSRGFRTEIHTRPGLMPDADLIVLDTDSRSSEAHLAAQAAVAAADWLRKVKIDRLYKKVDSVLRGHIVEEVHAIVGSLGFARSLLLAQNPSRGRVIRQGCYYIEGQPISESQFRLDPEYPRTTADVVRLLDPPDPTQVHLSHPGTILPSSGLCVAQASIAEEVSEWARRVDATTLPAGGADFFRAWLDVIQSSPRTSGAARISARPKPELFVCGSATESTRHFVQQAKSRGVTVFGLPPMITRRDGLTSEEWWDLTFPISERLKQEGRILLEVGLPKIPDRSMASQLCLHLAKMAACVLQNVPATRVYAEGGATAAAIAREQGWHQYTVLDQPATGIVTLQPKNSRHWFTVKPGSYSWPPSILNQP